MAQTEPKESRQESRDDVATPSGADLLLMKLKVIANHAAGGFAPIAAAAALALSVVAVIVTQSEQTKSGEAAGKLEKLNASLNASKIELEKLRAELAQSRNTNEDAHKQQSEQTEKLVLAISQVQTKLKIAPTLHEQALQPTSTPAAASAAPAPVATAAPASPASPATKASPQIQALKEALEKFNKQ